jgi:purine-nucleoside phosphorylase
MSEIYAKLQKYLKIVRSKTDFVPEIAIVLGSGLGGFVENIKIETIIPYEDIDGFPVSTAPGHEGQFVLGEIGGKRVVAMQGRFHYYEGYSGTDVVMPMRLMRMMGAQILILTNAAGGINADFSPGTFMLVTDHICLAPSPLIGMNIPELGTRFHDMSGAYDKRLQAITRDTAAKLDIPLREGTYIQTTGPQYETPAEIRMFRICGADAVGMSTAIEAIAAAHCGFKTLGISCISNMACGVSETPPNEQEVLEVAGRVGPQFNKLISGIIINID